MNNISIHEPQGSHMPSQPVSLEKTQIMNTKCSLSCAVVVVDDGLDATWQVPKHCKGLAHDASEVVLRVDNDRGDVLLGKNPKAVR